MRKKLLFFILCAGVMVITWLAIVKIMPEKSFDQEGLDQEKENVSINSAVGDESREEDGKESEKVFASPLPRADERVQKKPFGIHISPENSPVEPERFRGYHTGIDFEIFPQEAQERVEVKAVCSGVLVKKQYVSGYGGVAIQSCFLEGEQITVIYGHLKLSSIILSPNETIDRGEFLGYLGQANSSETDGERKHLHLGFLKGEKINFSGYVQNENELSGWMDPCLYICR